ncbi:MAG: hypothetical protein OHM57_02940 [Spiroplasma phoeniceum]|nr:MAG: hypothetical protein OHM57_02940 [Spiroplasma phoeniceum]
MHSPPPVAGPFNPNTGPNDGYRNAKVVWYPKWFNISVTPIEQVVFFHLLLWLG